MSSSVPVTARDEGHEFSYYLHRFPLDPPFTNIIVKKYEGEKDSMGRYHGNGKAYFENGDVYIGRFHRGLMHGKGKFEWLELGIKYEGTFKYNRIEGQGKYTWSDGSTYEGEVKNSLRHGHGKFEIGLNNQQRDEEDKKNQIIIEYPPKNLTKKEGIMYEGEWLNGKRHGHGRIYYNISKTCWYDGEWSHDERHGEGEMHWYQQNKGESIYRGHWKNNLKDGYGIMEWIERGEVYEGQWENDLQNGYGEFVWKEDFEEIQISTIQKQMCNVYRGEWKNGKREGHGTFFYANGAKYTGQWKDNMKDGEGFFIYDNGKLFYSIFEKDRPINNNNENEMDDNTISNKSISSFNSHNLLPSHLILHVEDLLPGNVGGEPDKIELRQLHTLIIRHNSSLRLLYERYSELSDGKLENLFVMTLDEFWRFLLDANLLNSSLLIKDVDICYHQMHRHINMKILKIKSLKKNHQDIINEIKNNNNNENNSDSDSDNNSNNTNNNKKIITFASNPSNDQLFSSETYSHNPNQPILFRDFIELLIRCVSYRFRHSSPLRSLCSSVRIAIEDYIQPILLDQSTPIGFSEFPRLYYSDTIQDLLEINYHQLIQSYNNMLNKSTISSSRSNTISQLPIKMNQLDPSSSATSISSNISFATPNIDSNMLNTLKRPQEKLPIIIYLKILKNTQLLQSLDINYIELLHFITFHDFENTNNNENNHNNNNNNENDHDIDLSLFSLKISFQDFLYSLVYIIDIYFSLSENNEAYGKTYDRIGQFHELFQTFLKEDFIPLTLSYYKNELNDIIDTNINNNNNDNDSLSNNSNINNDVVIGGILPDGRMKIESENKRIKPFRKLIL